MSTVIQIESKTQTQERDAFIEEVLESVNGFFKVHTVYLGVRMGFYKALNAQGALTSTELAARTDTSERYVREWLEEQAVAGILVVENKNGAARQRRYRLPASRSEVLTDRESPNYLAPITQLAIGASRPLKAIEAAIRTGGGVAFSDYGEDLVHGVSELNRPMFLHQLGQEYLPVITDIHRRLSAAPPARVADIGCGTGWSSIGMAQAYPKISVDGFDLDPASVRDARRNADQAGLTARVRFETRDGADPSLHGPYDLVTAFECIHDMSDPVGVLTNMRRLAGGRGSVIIMDERTQDHFTGDWHPIEHLLYGFSIMSCLPAGMNEKPSAETGTVMRAGTLRDYARKAGFCDVETLPIDNVFFRFYRLTTNCSG